MTHDEPDDNRGYPRRPATAGGSSTPARGDSAAEPSLISQLETSGVAIQVPDALRVRHVVDSICDRISDVMVREFKRMPIVPAPARSRASGESVRLVAELARQARDDTAQVQDAGGPAQGPDDALMHRVQKLEVLGTLTGGVAHDFNNLLMVMMGYTDFILQGLPAQDPLRQDVAVLKHSQERAASLTRQLLLFSRQCASERRVLDLSTIVRDKLKMLRRTVRENVEIVTVAQPDPVLAAADPGQIEQILMNLAVNARDAMPKGGKLTIETCKTEFDQAACRPQGDVAPGPYSMLVVSDTGTGIPPEVLSRIFEPFFTTKEKGKGTGLGLATVLGIVREHGGALFVDSKVGRGTSFRICLPQAAASADAEAQDVLIAPGTAGSETILVIDDEDDVRAVIERALAMNGYRVVTAANATEALVRAGQHLGRLDLIITDVVMPGPSMLEMLPSFRAMFPEVKVLSISGYQDEELEPYSVAQRTDYFLRKPFKPQEMLRIVRTMLDTRQPGKVEAASSRFRAQATVTWKRQDAASTLRAVRPTRVRRTGTGQTGPSYPFNSGVIPAKAGIQES